jgi:hypothetical protein
MLGQNQAMERRFVISAFSNYPFCNKTSGRWDKLLKPHYLLLQTFLLWDMDGFIASFHDRQKPINNMK